MENLKPIKVLVTGAGAPGITGTLYSLKKNFDNRKIEVIGTDIKDDVVGKYLCDKFYQVVSPKQDNYVNVMLEVCKKERVDVLLPQTTAELFKLSKNKRTFEEIGTRITLSDYNAIEIANNKFKLTEIFKKLKLPYPKFYLSKRFDDLIEKAKKLGFPEKPVIIKPPESSGMRGLRVLYEKANLKGSFFNEKPVNISSEGKVPNSIFITSQALYRIIGDEFPELMISEFLPGKEYSVDCFRTEDGSKSVIIPRTRDLIRTGITFYGTTEKNEEIMQYSKRIADDLNLTYMFGFQYKLDEEGVPKILESNPRIQGTMVLTTFADANIIYASVKHALNEKLPDFNIKWGTRIIRYWGGIGVLNKKKVDEIKF